MPASSALSLTESQRTGRTLYYGTDATAYTLKITRANCLSSISSTSGTYGSVTITYTLTNDRATTCSIRPYYSVDGGANWTEMTKGTGGDAKTALSTSASGTSHTFVWNTYDNMGNDWVGDVSMKIRAYDRDNYIGDWADSQWLTLTINNAPDAPTLVTPTDGFFQKDATVEFKTQIPADNNPSGSYSVLHAKIEVDVTSGFDSSSFVAFESRLDQSGWEYEDAGGSWIAITASGIPVATALVGNSVRYTVDEEDKLARTSLYWRASFGGVV